MKEEKLRRKSEILTEEAKVGLQRLLGTEHVWRERDGLIRVWFPSLVKPLLVRVHFQGKRPLYRIHVCIAPELDWETAGLTHYLLRENSKIFWGRFQNYEDQLVIEQNLFCKSTSMKQLAGSSVAWTTTALRITTELRSIGALTVPIDEDSPS